VKNGAWLRSLFLPGAGNERSTSITRETGAPPSGGSSLTAWREAAAKVGLMKQVSTLCCYHDDPPYIASMAGLRPLSQIGVYAMSKAAVVHMTKAMALEWGRHGINVNAICPGYIDTEINHRHWSTDAGQKLVQMLPRKRVGQPQDLDAVLMMLASDQSHFVNGAVIAADDGFAV